MKPQRSYRALVAGTLVCLAMAFPVVAGAQGPDAQTSMSSGTATGAGSVTVTITPSQGSPVSVTVPVAAGDTASQIQTNVANAINNVPGNTLPVTADTSTSTVGSGSSQLTLNNCNLTSTDPGFTIQSVQVTATDSTNLPNSGGGISSQVFNNGQPVTNEQTLTLTNNGGTPEPGEVQPSVSDWDYSGQRDYIPYGPVPDGTDADSIMDGLHDDLDADGITNTLTGDALTVWANAPWDNPPSADYLLGLSALDSITDDYTVSVTSQAVPEFPNGAPLPALVVAALAAYRMRKIRRRRS